MNFIPLTFDLSAKFFFHSDKVIVKKFLESVLNIKVNEYKLLENELPETNFKEYHMTTDIVLKVDNELIVNIDYEITKIFYVLIIICIYYIFDYGHQIQLDSKGKIYGEVESNE